MSDYNMNISGEIEPADCSAISGYLSLVNCEDSLKITILNNNEANMEIIKDLCRDNNIKFLSSITKEDDIVINAAKRKE